MAFTAKTLGVRAVEASVFAVLVWAFTGTDIGILVVIAAGVFALGVAGDAVETYIGDYAGNVLLGGLVAAAAVAVSIVGQTNVLLSMFGGLVGGWLVFDGVQHLRHGVQRPERTKNPVSAYGDTKRVAAVFRSLDDEPKTRAELAADLDADEAALDDALDYLQSSGRIEREDGEYRVNEDFSRSASLLSSPSRWIGRILEPFRL